MEIFSRLPFATFVTRFIKILLLIPHFISRENYIPPLPLFKERFFTSSYSPFAGKFFFSFFKEITQRIFVRLLSSRVVERLYKKMATTTFFPHIKKRRRKKCFCASGDFFSRQGKEGLLQIYPFLLVSEKGVWWGVYLG